MTSGSHRIGRVGVVSVVLAWLMVVSSLAAAQVDEPPGDLDDVVPVGSVDEDLTDPGVDGPGLDVPLLRLAHDVPVDDPLDPVLPPPKVSPVVVDDPLPELPVWGGNSEADRPGLVVGVSSVVVDPGQKRAAPSLSALSFEVGEKDAFPPSVRFEVETFRPDLVGSVSSFGAGFRVDASVPVGEVKWDSPVDVVLDFEDLPIVHGAGAASRMQFVLLEGCEIAADKVRGAEGVSCKLSTPLESVSDPTNRVLRASLSAAVLGRVLDVPSRVEAFALSAGGFSMLAITSGSSGPGGDFAAAPFQTVSSWDVGAFSGAAETAYPIELPAAAVGPTPSVMLSYSSAAIDGMSEYSNNQVGSIGAGWSYAQGHITRHLKGCTSSGHLCTAGDEYSIVLNGVSSRLVQVGSSDVFRVQDDPYWLVTRKDDSPVGHPDASGHYWEIVAKDGTTYIFGYTDDAAQTIPLGGGADHVYQWDLNEIRDTDGNSAFFSYGREINHYGSGLDYVQSSHLELIEYSILSSQPSLRVRFNNEVRCGDASTTFGDCEWGDVSTPTEFVDTPTDLWCATGVGCSQVSPTFWSALRLGSIQVQTLRNTSGDRWSTLALYDLAQFAPTPTADPSDGTQNEGDPDDSDPHTLLYRVHRRPEGAYTYNAYQQIEAEDYTYPSGATTTVYSNDVGGGDAVKWTGSGHISFHETEFEQGTSEVIVRVASSYPGTSSSTGQTITIYDSYPFGTALATIPIPKTGGIEQYATVSVPLTSGLSGTESLFLSYSGPYEARINWVRFKPELDNEGKPKAQNSLPAVDYYNNDWQWLGNRKNHPAGLAPMVVARIGTIRNEYGGKVSFDYLNDGDDCVESGDLGWTDWTDNVQHCFPVQVDPSTWITFLKWVVDGVTVTDPVMNTTQTYNYTYGTPRWAKNISPTAALCDTSWDVFRGHSWVEVEDPFGLTTRTWFYQGMKNDLVNCNGTVRSDADVINLTFEGLPGEPDRPDEYHLVGRPALSLVDDTAGVEFSRTDTDYTSTLTAGSGPRDASRFIGVDTVETTTTDGGTSKTTKVKYQYDLYGNVTQVYEHGDVDDNTDNRFTLTTYLYRTSGGYIVDRPYEVKLFDAAPTGDVRIGHSRYFWDSPADGAVPTEGHLFYERHYASTGSSDYVQTKYTYTADGRLETIRDPNLHTTTYAYEDAGFPYGRLVKVEDAEGHETTTGYDSMFRVNLVTDPRGLTTTADRDDYGRVIAVSAPGTSTQITERDDGPNIVEYYYTDASPARLWTESYVFGADSDNYVDSFAYADGFGRVFQTQSSSPTSGQRVVTTAETNNDGVLEQQSEPFETSGSAGAGAVSPDWNTVPLWHQYSYNTQGEQILDETLIQNTPQWQIATETEGWWQTTATDANGTDQVYRYDAFGNTVEIDEAIDGAVHTTTYEYDKADRLRMVTDAASPANVTEIQYDWLGRKEWIDDPDMGEWSYLYDDVGNLIWQEDGRDTVTEWEYDDINRPTRRFTGGTTLARWSYYTSGANAGLLDYSRAYDTSFGTIEQSYDAYDDGGRVTVQRTIVPGTDDAFRMQWSYDMAGNLLTMTYPDGASDTAGETVTYDYNTLGQPESLDGDDQYVTDATYQYWGAADEMTLGSGALEVARNWDYWNSRRLSRTQAGVSGATSNLANLFVSSYDANGNIGLLSDWTSGSANSGQRQCFQYDDANRLERAFTTTDAGCSWVDTTVGVSGYDHDFSYDPIGNLKTRSDVAGGATYNYGAGSAGPHAVTTIGSPASYSFTYDGNGNQKTRTTPSGSQTLDWNPDNRLESVAGGSDTTEFFYDADGDRIVRVDPDSTTIYIGGVYEYKTDVDTGVNLVSNPGFETSAGWTESVSGTLGEATSHHRSTSGVADNRTGTYGRTITNTTYGYLLSDPFTIEAGQQYHAAAWLRGEIDGDDSHGPNDPAWIIRVRFYDDEGDYLSYVNAEVGDAVDISATYVEYGGMVVAPNDAVTARMQLYFYNAQGWVSFDDVSFVKVGTSINLVPNPGFESSGSWTEVPSSALGEATNFYRGKSGIAAPSSGLYGYVISNTTYGYVRSDLFDVVGGADYDVHAWVSGKVDSDSSYSTNWIVRARWFDDQGGYLSYDNADSGPGSEITSSYQRLGGTVTAPGNADKAAVDLYFYNGTGWIAYDDVTFVAASGGSNLVDDPGFETGSSWTAYVSSALGESTSHWRGTWGFANPHSDNYSHVITNTAYGWLTSDSIPVSGGDSYDLKMWLRGRIDDDDSRNGDTWVLRAHWYNTSGNPVGYDIAVTGGAADLPTAWSEVGSTVTAPDTAATAQIRIYHYMGSGWINFDDITFASSAKETVYYQFGGETIGMRTGGELHWMFTDHLGSTATTYKADGTQQPQHQYYYPWGGLRGSTAPVVPTDVGYTGQTHDQSTGLMHYNARYYDPTIGRFISADTIVPNPGDPQQLNRYAYVTNNPIRYTDPTGHCRTDSAEAAACYAAAYSYSEASAADRFISRLWSHWYTADLVLGQQASYYQGQPETYGYSFFFGDEGQSLGETLDRQFILRAAADIGGMETFGNGWILLPDDPHHPSDYRPFRVRPEAEILGADGWDPGFVDNDGSRGPSPARHFMGFAALGYIYGEGQARIGAQVREADGVGGSSREDYESALLAIDLGDRLGATNYSGHDFIGDVTAAISDPTASNANPTSTASGVATPWFCTFLPRC